MIQRDRLIIIVLSLLLLALQYPLWLGSGSVVRVWQLREQVASQKLDNNKLQERNKALEAEVRDLKHGLQAIEERARSELGMVKPDETFYQIMDKKKKQK
ncbi:MAG: cell division protein FtsB [Proteobacteria bacterium]|nr:cell division protein FtsB [Pseudomonadota bacterium]